MKFFSSSNVSFIFHITIWGIKARYDTKNETHANFIFLILFYISDFYGAL